MMIDQDSFFDGLGFKRAENRWGVYYVAPSGSCCRIDHFDNVYVIEWAENENAAEKSLYEDGDLFDDRLPEDQLIHDVQLSIREDEGDCNRPVSVEELKKLLYIADIEGLCHFPVNAPDDEYDGEAERIFDALKEKKVPHRYEIADIICGEFDRSFDTKHEADDFSYLAYAIKTGNTHPCPVCRKTYFFGFEYDICPECGWEDDELQYNDLTYAGGANILSAKQAGVEYYMLKNKRLSDEAGKRKDEFYRHNVEAFSRYMKSRSDEDKKAMDDLRNAYIRELISLHLSDCVTEGDMESVLQTYNDEILN